MFLSHQVNFKIMSFFVNLFSVFAILFGHKLHIKTDMTHYQSLKKTHSSLWDKWIEQLAAAKAEAGNQDSVSILFQLRQREKIRRAHRQIR